MAELERLVGRLTLELEASKKLLSYFLDVFYNHERIHSSLDYLTPAEFEAQYESQQGERC